MSATFNPAQADLFGARELHRCTAPAPASETLFSLEREVSRLKSRLHEAEDMVLSANEELKVRTASYLEATAKLTDEINSLTRENARLRRRPLSAGSCVIPKETWRLLMQLVHPDKHNGSPASQAAAKWLNENKPNEESRHD